MRRRRNRLVAVIIGTIAVAAIGLVPATAAPNLGALGSWTEPFREDGFARPGTAGCIKVSGEQQCLPPGASIVVLPDGRILYWNALEGTEDIKLSLVNEIGDQARNSQSRVLTLAANPANSSWEVPTPSDASTPKAEREPPLIPGTDNANDPRGDSSLFCSDQAVLWDGRVIAFGGTDYYQEPRIPGTEFGVAELEGIREARVFDPETNTWASAGTMKYGRWYPSKVTMPDGRIFIASGVTKLLKPLYPDKPPTDSGTNVRQTETYDPDTGTSTVNRGEKSLPLFPRMHLLPNGRIYYGAAGQAFNPAGEAYDEALWNFASVYNPTTGTWQDIGVPGMNFPPDIAQIGFRGSSFQQMLPLRPPYNSATFITAGGVLLPTPGSYFPTDRTRLDRIDTSGAEEVMTSFPAGNLGQPRWYGTGVSLPTGQLLIVSGADADHVDMPGAERALRRAEIFTPNADQTGGSWQKAAIAHNGRTYHNNAVLLPDGRVLVGGHDPIANAYTFMHTNPAIPGVRTFANNFKDASFEIYSPPYLFRGPRPVIGGVSSNVVSPGSSLLVEHGGRGRHRVGRVGA